MNWLIVLLALMGVKKPGAVTPASAQPVTYRQVSLVTPTVPLPSIVPRGAVGAQAYTGVISPAKAQELALAIAQADAQGLTTIKIGEASYAVPSIVQAAQAVQTPLVDWLQYLGPVPVGNIVNTPIATGVYESAIPQQTALREIYQAQVGIPAPSGGVFTQMMDGRVVWQSDPGHPVYA